MSIIAVLATIGLPAMRGLNRGNTVNGAVRQLRDDLALARLKAIGGRTTVYVVFAPPWVDQRIESEKANGAPKYFLQRLTNLYEGQFTSYALVGARSMGDQPGQARPEYLTEWKRMPEGTFIPAFKLGPRDETIPVDWALGLHRTNALPFPDSTNWPGFLLPYVAFNPSGGLYPGSRDEVLLVAEGSVTVIPVGGGQTVEVIEQPMGNWTNNAIRISRLTGRTSLESVTNSI